MVTGKSVNQGFLTETQMRQLCVEAVSDLKIRGKKVLAIIPDSTRTAPVGFFFRLLCELIRPAARKLDFLVALGTHPPMSEEAINRRVGMSAGVRASSYADVNIFNHRWDSHEELKEIGVITADEVAGISGGIMKEDVVVRVNRLALEYDLIVIVGPTFPHEVVGFSGGNKYLFPGISGPEVLNFFHWLGAVITNPVINGTKYTPVRRIVDRASSMIPTPKFCISLVVTHEGVKGLYTGTPEESYSKAADLSALVHIAYVDRTFEKVLSISPGMYDDIWTAGKCMYKLEPVVADGGELTIFAPHITEISYTHGKVIDRIGYHVRDYFLKQMDRFTDVPRGVMAHSTHVKGIGTFEDGVETPRVGVVLSTRIPRARCKNVNLGYSDPSAIDVSEWEGREDEGILVVHKAGEVLYKLKS